MIATNLVKLTKCYRLMNILRFNAASVKQRVTQLGARFSVHMLHGNFYAKQHFRKNVLNNLLKS